jgi:hypothetical protein
VVRGDRGHVFDSADLDSWGLVGWWITFSSEGPDGGRASLTGLLAPGAALASQLYVNARDPQGVEPLNDVKNGEHGWLVRYGGKGIPA